MGSQVICCKCSEHFDERTLKGSWLDRRCPCCGKRISESAYDATARSLLKEHRRNIHRGDTHHDPADTLGELALSRYYTSEWFRLACAGKGSEAPDKGLFGLHVSYTQNGTFQLIPSDQDRAPESGWGVSAEYRVFDAIRREIARRTTRLPHAALIPHLVFPWLPGQKPKQWGARDRAETDCILLTQSCAIVVEVKRHVHHIRVSRDWRIRERSGESDRFKSASEVIEQVTNSAEAFAERQILYPPDRIFKLIVFVDALSFESQNSSFSNGLMVSALSEDGKRAPFVNAICALTASLETIGERDQIRALSRKLMDDFGNILGRREGRILDNDEAAQTTKRKRATDQMLDAIDARTRTRTSALYGSQLKRNLTCEVEMRKRKGPSHMKKVLIPGLLLTPTHAIFIDTKPWPVHVNTHVPFATVYVGNPDEGAEFVEDSIRHDWDLEAIHYKNRSGSLTLMNYVAKSIEDVERYRERNRVCTLNVFVNPVSFCTDCEDFRHRTFIGYWRRESNNIIDALERLVESSTSIIG